jgi:hypothetical protein
VSERETAPTTTDEPEEMRPIPDGGLRQSMPEWLRRPPAWRNLPKKDDAESAPVPEASAETVEHSAATPEKRLPEADTSEIDPRSLVDISDLPQWLQDIAARSAASSETPVMNEAEPDHEEDDMTDPEKRLESEPTDARDVAFEPVDRKRWDTPEQETKVYGGGPPKDNRSQLMLVGIGIAALVVLVILLLMIL